MVVNSAHMSFSLIAMKEHKIAPELVKEVQDDFLRRKRVGYPLPFTSLFIKLGALNHSEVAGVLRRREVMARRCRECFRKTYLLPTERSSEIQCEHCFGPLWSGRIDEDSKRLQNLELLSRRARKESKPSLYVMAARIALELNRVDEARRLLSTALHSKPGYKPAQNLIEEYLPRFFPIYQNQYRNTG
ncbi:MAG: hypothetical protein P1V97_07050 [Planctomycetota bacterium]|nr:hypothetical protein [Planctomycetota bacterium]